MLRAEFLHGQLLFFFASTAVALVLLGVYVFVSVPGSNLPVFGASRPLTGAGADVDAPHYLVPVALFGVLGASVNGLRSVVRLFREKSVSAYYLVDPTVFHTARILIGTVSALAVFTFLRLGVLQLGPELTPGLVLAAAFTSGVSESLLNRAVEAIAGDAVREGVATAVER